jgi:chromosome segregation ATPase
MERMESKLILRLMSTQISDKISDDLPLISIMKENDSSKHSNNCEKYLELLSNAFLLLNISSENISELSDSIVICEKMICLTQTSKLEEFNESIESLITELKTNYELLQQKCEEGIHDIKKEHSFDSIISDKIKFYSKKSKEYYNLVKLKENSLSKIGFTSTLKEESIQELRDNNEKLRQSLVDINSRLNDYKDFKPTEEAIKQKINEMKLEINEFDNYFNKL